MQGVPLSRRYTGLTLTARVVVTVVKGFVREAGGYMRNVDIVRVGVGAEVALKFAADGEFTPGSVLAPGEYVVYLGSKEGKAFPFRVAAAAPATTAATGTPRPNPAAAMAALRELPAGDFSFIYETGEHEMDEKGMPPTSAWAAKYNCGERVRLPDVVDTKPGYVYDSTRQDPGSDSWGHLPRPGTAQVFEYPNCKGGRLVADVVRIGKGHTEGLEPNVTEQLIKLMLKK